MSQIIKYGSSAIVNTKEQSIRYDTLRKHADEVTRSQKPTVIVSSGAIAVGKLIDGISKPNSELSNLELQALATVGQPELISVYQTVFGKKRLAQILFTDETLARQNDVCALIQYHIDNNTIPIINYNDGTDFLGVRTENDHFAATISQYLGIDLVFNIGSEHGFLDKNNLVIPHITHIDSRLESLCKKGNQIGNGGQYAKLQAAKKIMQGNGTMIQAKYDSSLQDILQATAPRTIYSQNIPSKVTLSR